jgi:hypothetical protein
MTKWYYYNKESEKIGVSCEEELRWRIKQGKVTQDTVIENEEGKQAWARNVKGMTCTETPPINEKNIVPLNVEETHSLAPLPSEPDPTTTVSVPSIEARLSTAHVGFYDYKTERFSTTDKKNSSQYLLLYFFGFISILCIAGTIFGVIRQKEFSIPTISPLANVPSARVEQQVSTDITNVASVEVEQEASTTDDMNMPPARIEQSWEEVAKSSKSVLVRDGFPSIRRYLETEGIDINARDNKDQTALYYVFSVASNFTFLKSDYAPSHEANWEYVVDIVEYLIGKGADVNLSGQRGNTPVHMLASIYSSRVNSKVNSKKLFDLESNSIDRSIGRMLVLFKKNNADFNTKNEHDGSPLDIVMASVSEEGLIKFLDIVEDELDVSIRTAQANELKRKRREREDQERAQTVAREKAAKEEAEMKAAEPVTMIKCLVCGGSGRHNKCLTCQGCGSVHGGGFTQTCNTCFGTGTLPCGTCNGRGTVPR